MLAAVAVMLHLGVEKLWWRLYGSKSWEYLVSGSLQKLFADSCSVGLDRPLQFIFISFEMQNYKCRTDFVYQVYL